MTLPIAVVGSEAAHTMANTVFGSPAGTSGELLEGSGPGAHLVPALLAVALASVLLGLAARVAGAWSVGRRSGAAPVAFALLPPAIYVFQEHLELLLQGGGIPFAAVVQPTFLPGLLAQLPFALAAYAVARALIGLADRVRRLIRGRRPVYAAPVRPGSVPRVRNAARRTSLSLRAHCVRGPPAVAVPG